MPCPPISVSDRWPRSPHEHIIDQLEASLLRNDLPRISLGDTVKVHVKVKEGEKERIQLFQGIVIGIKGGGMRTSFTVRKVASGVGVERIFPLNSPTIDKLEVCATARSAAPSSTSCARSSARPAASRSAAPRTASRSAPFPEKAPARAPFHWK